MDNINERVAKALGYEFHDHVCEGCADCDGWYAEKPHWHKFGDDFFYKFPNYSGDISAAWEIVGYLGDKRLEMDLTYRPDIRMTEKWFCFIDGQLRGTADTAPMAICLAFLKLKEGERD